VDIAAESTISPISSDSGTRRISVRMVAARVAGGIAGGATLGIVARLWMRLIADEPDYTRDGTIFVVMAFTIFVTAQTVAATVLAHASRPVARGAARVIGVVGLLPLFIGAGGIMLPTVVAGGFAFARTNWPRWMRVACLVVATLPIIGVSSGIIGDFGWSVHSLGGVALLVAVYGTVVVIERATFAPRAGAPRRPWSGRSVWFRVVVPVAALLIGGLLLLSVRGL
jgi:hypothetical protein